MELLISNYLFVSLYVQYFSIAGMDISSHPHKARDSVISVYFKY